MSVITVNNVTKAYTAHQVMALSNISFSVKRGDIVAVVGPSGCGKSTLLNLLAGIDPLDAGEITVAGQPLHSASATHLAEFRQHHVGVVFQFFNLLESLTVAENVALPLYIQGKLPKTNINQTVMAMLKAVELDQRAEFYPSQLSGGQMQRVAIARALVHKPSVVFADEPTGNLDSKTGQVILTLLKDICQQQATTLVIATHSNDVIDIADTVLRLDDGCLVA